MHEGVRTQATLWIPFAWMPVYYPKLAPDRLGKGFASHTARRLRLEHDSLAHVFKDWDIRTRDAVQLPWGGLTLCLSKVYLAAIVVYHPQLDKFAGSSG